MASTNSTGYTASRGRFCHSVISSQTLSVILEIVSLETKAGVDLGEVRRDLTGGQAAGGQREHDLVDPVQAPLALLDDHRLEARVPVTRHLDLHRPDLGEHRLGPGAVTRGPRRPAPR